MCILTFTISRRNSNIDGVFLEKVICLDKGVFIRILKSFGKTGRAKKKTNGQTSASYPVAKGCVYLILNSFIKKLTLMDELRFIFALCVSLLFYVFNVSMKLIQTRKEKCSKVFHF